MIESFCADPECAQSFGRRGTDWFWRQRGSPNLASGPFIVCLDVYRDALRSCTKRELLVLHCECGHSADTGVGLGCPQFLTY